MSTQEATLTLTLVAAIATLQLLGPQRAAHNAAGLDLPPAHASEGLRLTFGSFLGVAEALESLAAAGALDDPEITAFADLTLSDDRHAH